MTNKLKLSVVLNAVAYTKGVKTFNKELRASQYTLRQHQSSWARS